MRKLDSAIQRLFGDNASELVLETGVGAYLLQGGKKVPILKAPLTQQQVLGLLSEVVPQDMKSNFPSEGMTRFPYLAPSGAVYVQVNHSDGKLRAGITPFQKSRGPGVTSATGTFNVSQLIASQSTPSPDDRSQALADMLFSDAVGSDEPSGGGASDTATTIELAEPPTELSDPRSSPPAAKGRGRASAEPPSSPGSARTVSFQSPFAAGALGAASAPQSTQATLGAPTPPPPSKPTAFVFQPQLAQPEPAGSNGPAATAPAPAAQAPPRREAFVANPESRRRMDELLSEMLARRASDLHLTSGSCPMLRVDGDIVPVPERGIQSSESIRAMLYSIAPERNRHQFDEAKDTDFAHETADARFRVNVFEDRTGIGGVFRQIPNKIVTAEQMGLSKQILELCLLPKGLVLVTGPTGSGKSTTLAAMIDYVNRNREDHIITIEDPIEFVHPNKKCLVNQREVGVNTQSFKAALRAALREDPDIVLVGELRDLETIAIAVETAETGHLVFGTLHTNTAASTIDRIIDQFPADRQPQIRMMLSESLKGVISQTLCKKVGGGRVAAQEVLLCISAISNLIREGKTFQIPSLMQTGKNYGMATLNDALFELVRKKIVAPKDAYTKAIAKADFRAMLERGGFRVDGAAEG